MRLLNSNHRRQALLISTGFSLWILIFFQCARGEGLRKTHWLKPVLLLSAFRFLAGARFRWLAGGRGQLAPPRCSPTRLVHLLSARKTQRVGWHIFRDHRARANVSAIPDADGRNQRGIAANKDTLADRRGIFIHPVVI